MDDKELIDILKRFQDVIEIGNILTYCLRWLGWMFIKGLAWLVDGLEGVTDAVLGLKTFFQSEDVKAFVTDIQPFLYILLAFSFLYIGYMLIMNKKLNREQIAMNVFISLGVLVLLSQGMDKANKFTDDAINAVDLNENGTISQKIVKDNLTDISLYDEQGWKSTKLEEKNKYPQDSILSIDITEGIDKNFKMPGDKAMSPIGQRVLDNKIVLDSHGTKGITDLKNGWLDFFPEKYYRWNWDFWTMAISLFVIGMTELFITIKIAKLGYELAFNYILASLLAPADVADGQKLKQVLINILNTFLIIIMIFISMKVYLFGSEYISNKLDGMAYLIALIAISIAVVDGPVMAERIFGIDAGLKSGWGVIAGGYALGKSMSSVAGTLGKGAGKLAKGGLGGALMTSAAATGVVAGLKGGKGGTSDQKQVSLQNEMKADKSNNKGQNGSKEQGGINNNNHGEINSKADNKENMNGSNTTSGTTLQAEMREDGSGNSVDRSNDSGDIGGTTLQDEMQTSGFTSASGSREVETNNPSIGIGADRNSGATLQDEMNENPIFSGYREAAVTSDSSTNTNTPNRPSFSNRQEPNRTSDVPSSTKDIPMPSQNRIETRTLGQYARDRVKDKINGSKTIQRTKRTYQLGENTGENLRKILENKKRNSR